MTDQLMPCIECGLMPDECRCPPAGYAPVTDQPTDGAMKAARVFKMLKSTRGFDTKFVAETIDREAVAPAVRELIEALDEMADWTQGIHVYCGDKDRPAVVGHARAAIARYRHLLKESE